MDISCTGLVLEGGGLRGVYTSGVLQYFMENEMYFPYVIGVSMGACNAANYVSRQPERNRIVNISYVNDPRYLSYMRLMAKGELFGMDFIFNTIPNALVPFDYKTFFESSQKCITTVTDCFSGEPAYFEKTELGDDYMKILQASSSLPFIAKPVHYKGRIYMDGGLSDSIPIRKSLKDGNKKNVLILTQPRGYKKEPQRFASMARLKYPDYKGLVNAFEQRHIGYNNTLTFVESLEKKKEVFVIRPDSSLNAGRVERNKTVLYEVYDRGYKDAQRKHNELCAFLES